MSHITSIGLDVHARSVTASAFNPYTDTTTTKKFKYSPFEIAEWILSFESPKAVYESGVTGFHLARMLKDLGVDCIVGAVSKMQRPPADKKKKNDKGDAAFLARLLSTNNVVEVMIPDTECESMRDLARALEDAREDITRTKQRLSKFLLRHGHVFDVLNDKGQRMGMWTRAHWKWIYSIDFPEQADKDTLKYYIDCVRQTEIEKQELEKLVARYAKLERWKSRVDALRLIKGIETMTAFSITVEAQVFSRFDSAKSFAAWLGLVPSESSSGERIKKGGITKTGNTHARKLLIESAWHFVNASPKPKKLEWDQQVKTGIQNHANKANKRLIARRIHLRARGKKPVVANCATARELACWIWAVGRMVEGTL